MILYKNIVDEYPIPVKILQIRKQKRNNGEDISRAEITRDFESKAGFWVNINELITE